MVVQPSFGRACWCSGRTRGRGDGMSGGRVSCGTCCLDSWMGRFEMLLRFERKREMMFEMEKLWSDGLVGTMTVILILARRATAEKTIVISIG